MSGSMAKVEEMLCSTKGAELYTASFFHPRPRAIIVIAHSLTHSAGQYSLIVQALWDAEFSVYLYNWRHQVREETPNDRSQTQMQLKDAVGDFALVLEQAKTREAQRPTFVVALDEGAAISLSHCAAREVSLLTGVVLFTPSLLPPVSSPTCTDWSMLLLDLFLPRWTMTVVRNGAPQDLPIRQYRLCVELARQAKAKLSQFKTPVLVLHGKHDVQEQIQSCRMVMDCSSSIDKTLLTMRGKSEDLWMNEMTPTTLETIQCIVEWIRKRT